jgi:succinoglycan biosynthesis transport protein ExoP
MLQSPVRLTGLGSTGADDIAGSVLAADKFARLISVMRRHTRLITIFCLAGVAVGIFYVVMAEPLYTASATIIIDNRQVLPIHEVSTDPTQLDTSEVVESQVEVLRSEKIGLAVVKRLNLSEDPTFVDPSKSWIGKLWVFFMDKLGAKIGSAHLLNGGDPGPKRRLMALKTLNRNLHVSRVGHTFVLQVDYTSPDPVRAAEMANAFTHAYLLEQLSSRVEAIQHGRQWLQQRAEELRQLSVDADLAVQKFRADNHLLTTKGILISEQQLNEMTTQLVNEKGATAQARARYLRIRNIIDTHQTESAVTESLGNSVINDLRTKYLDASKRKSDLERKLGPTHIAVVNLNNTMDELNTLLFQELGRIAESYRNDYEVAAAREKVLAENLKQQQSVAVASNEAQVQLRQLEQKADAYKKLYESYFQHYHEAAQQESFPMTDARVISPASQPLVPSHPRKPLVLAISLVLGAFAGGGVAILREFMDHAFRTAEQARDELGVEVLGMLPVVSPACLARRASKHTPPILRYSIDEPFSAFAETLRSAKVAADLALQGRSPKIIGLVSLLPEEGKSTVAKNFASQLALTGAKTLLIDADTRKPALTRAIVGGERRQSSQSDLCMPPLAELLKDEPDSGLQILPCVYAKDHPLVAEGLSPAMLHALLQSSDRSFDYIVIDLPPIAPTVNARGMASSIDAFIFVVEWGKTSRGAVRAALAEEHSIKDKLLGIILNKVDMKKLNRYEHHGSVRYYHRHYENYYEPPKRA